MEKQSKILIVDDDPEIRFLLQKILQSEKHNVSEAENGKVALEQVGKEWFDLIVCDYMMPEMDGAELVRQLKSQAHTAMIPIIMLTAVGDKEVKLIRAGVADYIVKPVKAEEFLVRVNRSLEDIHSRRMSLLLEFTGALAHEINQPLGVLMGRLDILEELAGTEELMLTQIQQCQTAVDRLTRIVQKFNQLKDYRTKKYLGNTSILDIHEDG